MTSSKAELARALHASADLLVGRGLDDAAIAQALGLIEEANAILATGEELSAQHRVLVFASEMVADLGAAIPEDGAFFDAFSLSPFSGKENPLRPTELKYQRVGQEVHAEMIAGVAYEGATDRSHGGLTAAVFDDVMGALQRIVGHHGYTRTLNVSYLGRVPIDEPVTFVARLETVEERTFTLSADATFAGEKVATASAVFTKVDFAEFTDRR